MHVASSGQRRLWFVDQLQRGRAGYVIPEAYRLRGPLDPARLEAAFETLVARHPSLRTAFRPSADGLLQVVVDDAPFHLRITEGGEPGDDLRGQALDDALREEWDTPFDLGKAPLIRARVIRFAADDYILVFTTHHVVSDGWSQGILRRELGDAYSGRPMPSAASVGSGPQLSYVDYALTESASLGSARLTESVEYWRRELLGLPEQSRFAGSTSASPSVRAHDGVVRGGGARRRLTGPDTARLRRCASRRGTSVFTLMLAVFGLALGELEGTDDLAVGVPVSTRTDVRWESIVGLFLNMVAVRMRVDRAGGFAELLSAVRRDVFAALDHADAPFDQVVQATRTQGNPGDQPLFRATFSFQPPHDLALDLAGVEATAIDPTVVRPRYDLEMIVSEGVDEADVLLVYDPHAFAEDEADRFLAGYLHALARVVEAPETPIAELPFLRRKL